MPKQHFSLMKCRATALMFRRADVRWCISQNIFTCATFFFENTHYRCADVISFSADYFSRRNIFISFIFISDVLIDYFDVADYACIDVFSFDVADYFSMPFLLFQIISTFLAALSWAYAGKHFISTFSSLMCAFDGSDDLTLFSVLRHLGHCRRCKYDIFISLLQKHYHYYDYGDIIIIIDDISWCRHAEAIFAITMTLFHDDYRHWCDYRRWLFRRGWCEDVLRHFIDAIFDCGR